MLPDQPNPELLWEAFNAHQKTAAMRAAIDLDLFTAIGEGTDTPAALAARCSAAERGVRILCDYLAIAGFLTKSGSNYGLTPTSAAFLDRRSPACMATMPDFINTPKILRGFQDLTATVRRGGTTLANGGVTEAELDEWVTFAKAMAPMMGPPAAFIAGIAAQSGPKRVLDIAAGHGLFGIAVAKAAPGCQIFAQDWGKVLAVASENARAAGVSDRYNLLPGDTFTAGYGSGYDVALVTNLLHHFDARTCVGLLAKIHAALAPGGKALVLEFVPNEDRVSPPLAASFSLMMLGLTPGGDAYTFPELAGFLSEAGFQSCTVQDVPQSPQRLIAAIK